MFLISIGTALQTAAPSDSAFVVAWLILGMSSGFLSKATPLLLNEVAYPAHRPVANALYMCGYFLHFGSWIRLGASHPFVRCFVRSLKPVEPWQVSMRLVIPTSL